MSEENDDPETGGQTGSEPTAPETEPVTPAEPEPAKEPEVEAIVWREVDKPYSEKINAMLKDAEVPANKQAALYKAFSALQDEIGQEYAEKTAAAMKEWEQEQGDNLAKNQELARRGSAALGFDADQLGKVEMVIGTKAFMTACVNLGKAMSEDTAKGLGGSGITKDEEMSTEAFIREQYNNVMKG